MSPPSDQDYCGVGIRGVAMAVDAVVWFVAFFVAVFAVGALTGQVESTGAEASVNLVGVPAVVAFGLFLGLGVGYHALLEWRYGKTVGKHLVKIRVREAEGGPLSLRSSVVRNLLRLVDFLPILYLVGIATLVESDRARRLGDRVADTVVVRP